VRVAFDLIEAFRRNEICNIFKKRWQVARGFVGLPFRSAD